LITKKTCSTTTVKQQNTPSDKTVIVNAVKENINKELLPKEWNIMLNALKEEVKNQEDVREIVKSCVYNPEVYKLDENNGSTRKLHLGYLGLTMTIPSALCGTYCTHSWLK
jgi:hypothetical protein